MKKKTIIFIIVLTVIGIISLAKNNSLSQIKSSNKTQTQINIPTFILKNTPKTEKPSSNTQSAESIGQDEINLNVNFPANGIVVNQSSILVEGTAIPEAFVFVNENELRADNVGNFSTTINLDEGDNLIVVVASDDKGNNSEKELNVTYDSGITQ